MSHVNNINMNDVFERAVIMLAKGYPEDVVQRNLRVVADV